MCSTYAGCGLGNYLSCLKNAPPNDLLIAGNRREVAEFYFSSCLHARNDTIDAPLPPHHLSMWCFQCVIANVINFSRVGDVGWTKTTTTTCYTLGWPSLINITIYLSANRARALWWSTASRRVFKKITHVLAEHPHLKVCVIYHTLVG